MMSVFLPESEQDMQTRKEFPFFFSQLVAEELHTTYETNHHPLVHHSVCVEDEMILFLCLRETSLTSSLSVFVFDCLPRPVSSHLSASQLRWRQEGEMRRKGLRATRI